LYYIYFDVFSVLVAISFSGAGSLSFYVTFVFILVLL